MTTEHYSLIERLDEIIERLKDMRYDIEATDERVKEMHKKITKEEG